MTTVYIQIDEKNIVLYTRTQTSVTFYKIQTSDLGLVSILFKGGHIPTL